MHEAERTQLLSANNHSDGVYDLSDVEDNDLRRKRSTTSSQNAMKVNNIGDTGSDIEALTQALRATPVTGELSTETTHEMDLGVGGTGTGQAGLTLDLRDTHGAAGTPPRSVPAIEVPDTNTPPVTPLSQSIRSEVQSGSHTPSIRRRRLDLLELDRDDDYATGSPKGQKRIRFQDDDEIQFVSESPVIKLTTTTCTSRKVKPPIRKSHLAKSAKNNTEDTPIVLE